jgi:cytochrome bd ubiquinol oxidase subunit I
MDAVMLARIQFALTVGFHFLFPPTTFALTLCIVLLEGHHLRTGQGLSREISSFLVKILGLVFVLGTATGIVMEFSFGNNWAQYSRLVGDIFGAPLAAEGVFAFFLESVFIGVLLFARDRVSQKTYFWSAFLVFFGAHLSGLWIIIANSWMQTPAGFAMENGRAVLTDFLAAAFNPSTVIRYLHTIFSGWLTGSLLLAAIAAWSLLKGREQAHARQLLKLTLAVVMAAAFLQLATGHLHSVQVARTQPAKMAAFEGLWQTQKKAPLALFAVPDEKNGRNRLYIGIPGLLSFLVHFDVQAEVTGFDRIPEDQRPPILVTFASYHVMIGLGMLFLALAGLAMLLWWRRRLDDSRWFLRLLLVAAPLGYIATEFGWLAAEIGRQPWAVYGILRTANAASVSVPAWQIAMTLGLFVAVYVLLSIVALKVLGRIIRTGIVSPDRQGY